MTITGTEGPDFIDGVHVPTGQAFPSDRDDLISGLGGKDTLFGLQGGDTLDGGKANDTLHGGDGNDLPIGEKGTDKLFGEAGADTFRFNTTLKGKPDKIKDFVAELLPVSRTPSLGVMMEPEVTHGTTTIQPRVQARGGEACARRSVSRVRAFMPG